MTYQTKSWERDRPPEFRAKASYIGDLPVRLSPRYQVGSRVEAADEFAEMTDWLKANCRWTYRIIGQPLPERTSEVFPGFALFMRDMMRASILAAARQAGTDADVHAIVSVEFRRKEDATLFKMFWGAEG